MRLGLLILIASPFGFAAAAMLEIESPAKRAVPEVKFG